MTSHSVTGKLPELWAQTVQDAARAPGPSWLQTLRVAAATEFLQNGLPGNKDEAWKYTSLRHLEELQPDLGPLKSSGRFSTAPAGMDGFGFRITDGGLETSGTKTPKGVTLLSLHDALSPQQNRIPERLRRLLESFEISGRSQAFQALNTALLNDGVVIHVAAGVDAGTCQAEWLHGGEKAPRLLNFRLVLLLEPGARLGLLERFRTAEPNAQAVNVVTQAELGAGAKFDHIRLQSGSDADMLLTFTTIEQSGDSQYQYTGFDLGGKLVRHDIHCRLAGPGAQATINGAFVLDRERHVDHHLCVDHLAPSCSSEQFFRGVLDGRSRGVFNGKALIRPGADGSKVRQSNANLLLSDLAEMDTKPELEIYADEVEASHGATVGQLDEQAVFYLRCRGLSEAQARRMLTSAFCRSVSARLANRDLAEQVDQMMETAMQGFNLVPGAN